MRSRTAAVVALSLGFAATARAATWPRIMSREYAIDLYEGVAFGPPRLIGMGGAATALAEGSAGVLANPAAAAMRPASSRELWDWDANLDGFTPSLGSDFDNDGSARTDALSVGVIDGGALGLWRAWGVGVSFRSVEYHVHPEGAAGETVGLAAAIGRLTVARAFLDEALVAGVGVRLAAFTADRAGAQLLDARGNGLEGGLLVAPRGQSLRIGVRGALPALGAKLKTGCNPDDCGGHVLPLRAVAPWEVAIGVAYRVAPLAWNRLPEARFSDERAWTFAADLLVTGDVASGAGIGAFTDDQLQPSGRHPVLSLRVGAEHELAPGRLRMRAGSYWEPPRLDGTTGRLHLTTGAELRLFSFPFWGAERRVALAVAVDGARQYGNAALSLGFWH
jgi:hypothetical protein